MSVNTDFLASIGGTEMSIIPVMQVDGDPKSEHVEIPEIVPVLALRNAVLFPGTVYPVTIGREKSIRLIRDAEKGGLAIAAVPQVDVSVEDPRGEDLNGFGTAAKVLKSIEMPDGTITAILQGLDRVSVGEVVEFEPYLKAHVLPVQDIVPEEDDNSRMIAESLKEKSASIIRSSNFAPREAIGALKSIDNFAFLVNFIATTIDVENIKDKIADLQRVNLVARIEPALCGFCRRQLLCRRLWNKRRRYIL